MKLQSLALLIMSIPAILQASSVTPNFSPERFSVGMSLGALGGESREYVYDADTGQKLSQLNWKIKNVGILKADVSWDVWNWLTLNVHGWASLGAGKGQLDDYDWLDGKPGASDWSHHTDTPLNYANEFNLNLKGWLVKGDNYKFGTMMGYQQTRFSWTAFGGHYKYGRGEETGNFPVGLRGIGYSQTFTTPYVGLVGQYRYQNIELNAQLKYSDWVTVKDNDEHYMRQMTFREKIRNSSYYSVSLDAGYYVTPHARLFTELGYSLYKQGKGGMDMFSANSSSHDYGNVAGIANKNYSLSVGLNYRF